MEVGWHNVPVDTGQLLVLRVNRIPLPKEQRFELCPNIGICPVLTEDIGGIEFSRQMREDKPSGGDGLADTVEREHDVALVQLAMRDR